MREDVKMRRCFTDPTIGRTLRSDALGEKRVNYRMLDWKHYKNTVKSNVLEGFTAFMAKNV